MNDSALLDASNFTEDFVDLSTHRDFMHTGIN